MASTGYEPVTIRVSDKMLYVGLRTAYPLAGVVRVRWDELKIDRWRYIRALIINVVLFLIFWLIMEIIGHAFGSSSYYSAPKTVTLSTNPPAPRPAAGTTTNVDGSKSQMSVTDEVTQQGITLTEEAASKVGALLAQEGRDDLRLRVAVQPGGCSGLKYQLYFDERDFDGDVVGEYSGVSVVTDKMSAPYLTGATIDFVDTIEKQGFTIDNPNATGSCACGDSFH